MGNSVTNKSNLNVSVHPKDNHLYSAINKITESVAMICIIGITFFGLRKILP